MLLPVPVISVEMECECGATIEACIPAEIAGRHGIGSIAASHESWMELSPAKAEEAVNVCPFCSRKIDGNEIMLKMLENACNGRFPSVYWVFEEAVCEYCGEELDDQDVKARMKEMGKLKFCRGWKFYNALMVLQNLQSIECQFCDEGKYFCAYCRRNHIFGSEIYFEHRKFAVRRKTAVREAGKAYREVVKSEPGGKYLTICLRRDAFRAFRAILEKRGDEVLAESEWGASCNLRGKNLFVFFK